MRNSKIATTIRRRSAAACAIAGLAATAACGDDPMSAPPSAPEVSTPNALIVPPLMQEVTVRIKDINGNLVQDGMIPTDWYALKADGDTVKRQVAYDNHWNPEWNNDLHPSLGIMTVRMPMAAKQRICLYNFSDYHAFDMAKPHCVEVMTNGAYKVDAGTLVMRRMPVHTIQFKDWFGKTLKGAKVHVKGPLWYFDFTFVDGGFGDAGAPDGKIDFRGYAPGVYEWCEVAAPSGYNLTNPTCGSVTLSWEGVTMQTLYHSQKILALP